MQYAVYVFDYVLNLNISYRRVEFYSNIVCYVVIFWSIEYELAI